MPHPLNIALDRAGARVVRVISRQPLKNAVRVAATHRDTAASAAGIRVRFSVVDAAATVNGGTTVDITTDEHGLAAADVTLDTTGYALICAELVDAPDECVFFGCRSEDVGDRISVYADPCVSVDQGAIDVIVSVLDHRGQPVSGAPLSLEGHLAVLERAVMGSVKEVAPGRYHGRIETTRAGAYAIVAQDRTTFAKGTTAVHVVPGPAERFRMIGTTDPRAARPFDVLDLRVQLVDRYGNPLAPHRIEASIDGAGVPATFAGDTATFRIRAAGYTHVPVRLRDSESRVEDATEIHFAACWLSNPGFVVLRDRYRTALYAIPPSDRPASRATVTIEFDVERTAFARYAPSSDVAGLVSEARVEDGAVIVDARSEIPCTAEEYPQGVPLGEIEWDCLGEGRTCFELAARMSPSTPKWEMCVEQKTALNSCVCICILYPKGDDNAKKKGEEAVDQLLAVISSQENVSRCCPILTKRIETREVPKERINKRIGENGIVETEEEWSELVIGSEIKNHCMNLFMVPTKMPGDKPGNEQRGKSAVGPIESPDGVDSFGTGTLDPEMVNKDTANVGAHELAHQLGLLHVDDEDNLMHKTFGDAGYKSGLTREQCRTIFETLDKYPCS